MKDSDTFTDKEWTKTGQGTNRGDRGERQCVEYFHCHYQIQSTETDDLLLLQCPPTVLTRSGPLFVSNASTVIVTAFTTSLCFFR